MAGSTTETARQRARRHIRDVLGALAPGSRRLPTVAVLADDAGVGLVTMHRAVQDLAGEQVLDVVPGGGIFARVNDPRAIDIRPSSRTPRSGGPAWRRIRDALEADLSTQAPGHDEPLPSLKELRRRHGASYPTLRKALQSLVDDGKLRPFGRGYRRLLPTATQQGRSTLVVIAATDNMDMLIGATPRSEALWRSLEQSCRTRGLQLLVISYAKAVGIEQYPDGRTCDLRRLQREQPVLGYVVLTLGWALGELAGLLSRNRRATCVLDENGGLDPAVFERHRALCHVPVGGDRRPGREMGVYLSSRGHRRVAILCAEPTGRVFLRRAEGLVEGLGVGAEVVRVCPGTVTPLRHPTGTRGGRTVLLPEADDVARFLDGLDPLVSSYARHDMTQSVNELVRDHLDARTMVPLFEQTLAHRDITAWVGFNDRTALMALQFLAERGVRVPQDISVVGFDDTITALGNGLTSHNPNMTGVVNAMVDYLFAYGAEGAKARKAVLEVSGLVIERVSSGQAGGQ